MTISKEKESNRSSVAELGHVVDMLTTAEAAGLEPEVVWSFGNERASGHEVEQAVENALYEWDI